MDNYHNFEEKEVISLLEAALNKTLREIDVKKVFKKTINTPKITGIAGDVIEQSLFGYPADNRQEPDLNIDGELVELKTTGIKVSVKSCNLYEAKEPMSITAVSPEKITEEEFETSKFWKKLRKTLFVYYLYSSRTPVPAAEYANFEIKGYQFHEFSGEDKKILENDWKTVKTFISTLQNNYVDYKSQYPRISSELRSKLLFIDTAPKWPNRPRFRLKRRVITGIVQEHFDGSLEQLPVQYTSYEEIDEKCQKLSQKYKNYTIRELVDYYNIDVQRIDKSIGERVVVRMFDGKAKKMQKIELFNKIGLIGKTIVLTKKGLRTEDIKFFPIDFCELSDSEVTFENSQFYDYFFDNQFLCVVFQEPSIEAPLEENQFKRFERIYFDSEFIFKYVKPLWDEMRDLILNKRLRNITRTDRLGNPKINKTGVIQSAPNFPKSSSNIVFVRGSGKNSTDKSEFVNDVLMYKQYVWIKGSYIAELVKCGRNHR